MSSSRLERLFYFTFILFICNKNYIKLSSSSHEAYFKVTNKVTKKNDSILYSTVSKFFSDIRKGFSNEINYIKYKVPDNDVIQKNRLKKRNKIYLINQRQRHTQEVCNESTCDEKLSISIRVTPYQDKISEVETLLTGCALNGTVKQFKQSGKEMFVAKVCFGNIKNLAAVKKKKTIIEKLQGGTKTSKSKMIRKKPKIIKQRSDCNGTCCKDCPDHKVKTVVLTTSNYDEVSTLVKGCFIGDMAPRKVTVKNVEKYVFDMCRSDKFVLKRNSAVTELKTFRDKNYFRCKKSCDGSRATSVTVVTNDRDSMKYVEDCAYDDSFNENNIVEEGDKFSVSINICINDRLNLYHMKGIESAIPVCAVHNTFSNQCGAAWAKAAPTCCEGLECEGTKCIHRIDPCKKTCVDQDSNLLDENNPLVNVLVVTTHIEDNEISTETNEFIENCAASINGDPAYNETTRSFSYPISICNEDHDTMKNNPNILSVENDNDSSHNLNAETECKKDCTEEYLREVTVTTKTRDDMEYVRACAMPEDSFSEDKIVEVINEFSIDISMCNKDRFILDEAHVSVESVVPKCAILDTFSQECGSPWINAAPICCSGFVCGENQRCISDITSNTKACDEGDCCKTCVLSDAAEEGQYPETDPNQIMKVVYTTKSGKGKTFMRACATADETNVVLDDGTNAHSTTICKDDFDTIKKNGHIKSIDVEGLENNEAEMPEDEGVFQEQEQCGVDSCCKACSTSDAAPDVDQLMEVMITVDGFEANFLLDSCMIDMTGEVYQNEDDKTVYPMTICRDDYSTIANNVNIQIEEINSEATKDSGSGDNTNSTSADSFKEEEDFQEQEQCGVDSCCKACSTSDLMSQPGQEQQPGTDIDQLMKVLVTTGGFAANDFLQTCATALYENLKTDDSGNTVYPVTICKDDYSTIENNANILSIEEDASEPTEDSGPGHNSNSTSTIEINEAEDFQQEQCGVDSCCKACSTSDVTPNFDQIMKVFVTVDGFEANFLLESCMIEMTGNVYQNDDDKTVYPMTICKDDFDTISSNQNIIDVAEDIWSGDTTNSTSAIESNFDEEYDKDAIQTQDQCDRSCAASDTISLPGEEQQPGTNVDQLMKVLITSTTDAGSQFLQTCAIALYADVKQDQDSNPVYPVTICKDDYEKIQNNPNIINIVGDTSGPVEECTKSCKMQEMDDNEDDNPDVINVFITASKSDEIDGFLTNCMVKSNGEANLEDESNAVYPLGICKNDYDIIQRNPNIKYIVMDENNQGTGDQGTYVGDNSGSTGDFMEMPSGQGCEAGTCCKTCTTSDAISLPGEQQKPETDINKIKGILATPVNEEGGEFLQTCATAMIRNIEKDENSNDVYAITICEDDFDTMKSNPNLMNVVEDNS